MFLKLSRVALSDARHGTAVLVETSAESWSRCSGDIQLHPVGPSQSTCGVFIFPAMRPAPNRPSAAWNVAEMMQIGGVSSRPFLMVQKFHWNDRHCSMSANLARVNHDSSQQLHDSLTQDNSYRSNLGMGVPANRGQPKPMAGPSDAYVCVVRHCRCTHRFAPVTDRLKLSSMRALLSQYAEGCFGPDDVEVLVAAFDEAWKHFGTSGANFGSDSGRERARQRLARSIIVMAVAGERDIRLLRENALLHMAQSSFRETVTQLAPTRRLPRS
jgi:hypothetical protein